MSNYVLVINANKQPLNPIHPAQARRLLTEGKAGVFRRYPFTIIFKEEVAQTPEPITLKLDPGSKVTGISLLQGNRVIWGAELSHRGQQIKDALTSRQQLRRSRRNRKTRYRKPRFLNRTRPQGELAPSLMHRVLTTLTWVKKLIKFAPIDSMAMELVKFDLPKEENPEISGVEYQQGELMGYELREYLLEKFNRTCQYCGAKNVPLQVEHIVPKSKGGSNRASNLTLACEPCNRAKSNQEIQDFLSGKPDLLARILKQAKTPLKDAAAVNSTRWRLFNSLKELGLPVTIGSGGQTKFNRLRLNLNKTHWIDSACVSEIPENLVLKTSQPLLIQSTGHGTRQMCGTNKYGFPIRHRQRLKKYFGFETGDLVKAVVTKGKKQGVYVGRVLCRASGSFDLRTAQARVTGINHRYCQLIHGNDGYNYGFT